MEEETFDLNNQPAHDSGVVVKKKRKKGFLFWASLTVMIAALIALGVIAAGYLEGCMMYNDIADDAFKDRSELNLADMKVDWEKLLAMNPDTVAWVYVPGTQVNYPVVHTTDNEKYLHTSFKGHNSYVSWGAIFADCNNSHDLSDPNVITYGHNMNDGSMYGLFAEMRDSGVFNSHRNIYFLTPTGNYRLRSFALCDVAATEKIIQTKFSTDANRISYINDKISRSIVTPEGDLPDPAAMSKIFTFSTCDNTERNHRYMTFAYVAESTVDGVGGLG